MLHGPRLDHHPEQPSFLQQILYAPGEGYVLGVARAEALGSQYDESALVAYRFHPDGGRKSWLNAGKGVRVVGRPITQRVRVSARRAK